MSTNRPPLRRTQARAPVGRSGAGLEPIGRAAPAAWALALLLSSPSSTALWGINGFRTVPGARPGPAFDAEPVDDELFERLRALRKRLADGEGVPAYIVFSDAVLRQMAARVPKSAGELLALSGVGPVKLERYGEAFLEVLREG